VPTINVLNHVTTGGISATTTLLVGLIGVLVGGLLNLGVEHRLEATKTRARVMAAGRLLSTDLIAKLGAVLFIESIGKWMPPDDVPGLPDRSAWNLARPDLAYNDLDAWLTVARVYVGSENIEQIASRRAGAQLTDKDRDLLKAASNTVSEAIAILDVFADEPSRLRHPIAHRAYRKRRNATRAKLAQARKAEAEAAKQTREASSSGEVAAGSD